MKNQSGYLMIDHRASPGLPEDIARWAGYDPKFCREGKLYETATLCCAHCNASVVKHPFRTRERACCLSCDHKEGRYICDGCDFTRNQPGYVHTPYKKVVDDALNRTIMGSPPKLLLTS